MKKAGGFERSVINWQKERGFGGITKNAVNKYKQHIGGNNKGLEAAVQEGGAKPL